MHSNSEQIMQVDGENGVELDEENSDEMNSNLEFCKTILTNLLRDSFDKFEVISLCDKFGLNVRDLQFSKQKYLLQKTVLEHIMKEENDEFYRRCFAETIAYLDLKKDSVYKCSLVGCLFSTSFHRKYIKHLKSVHVRHDNYLCQFKHECRRRFTTFQLLSDHIKEEHIANKSEKPREVRNNIELGFKIPCQCIMRSCNGRKFVDLKELLSHINNFHLEDPRECVFENCAVKFNAGSASRNHFRIKHLTRNMISLKETHLVMPNLTIRPAVSVSDDIEVSEVEEVNIETCNDMEFDTAEDPDDVSEGEGSEDEEDFFLKAYCDFMNRMCHFKFVPHSTMQAIALEFHEHSLKAMEEREKVLRRSLKDVPGITSEKIDEIVDKVLHDDKLLKAQKELNTEHKRNNFIKTHFNYVEPEEHVLNKDEVKAGHRKDVYHYVPMDKALKLLVEDRTFIEMMEREREKDKADKDVLKDIKDGAVFKSVDYFRRNPDALVCLMYSDAVELTNPLGSGKGKHKITQIFWTLADIPRNQRSKIDKIQLALVVKEKLLKKYGEKIIYKSLVADLKKLEDGIEIEIPVPKLIKCGLLVHSADNLEAMQVGGFSTCFSSRDVCRWCHCQYKDLPDHIHDFDGDGSHSYWSIEEYDRIANDIEMAEGEQDAETDVDVENPLDLFEHGEESSDSSSDESDQEDMDDDQPSSEADEVEDGHNTDNRGRYGLRKRCPFNDLQSFHAVYSFPPDVLHDLFEGVVAQDLCGIIKILSEKGWFSLDDYNNALKKQEFKSFERDDKPQEIKSFKAKKLPGKAVSVWTHLRNFGFLIHQFVGDFDDQVLVLGLELADIVERVTAVECRQYEIDVLEEKILGYLDHRKEVFEEFPLQMGTAKPKHHYLSHYCDAMRGFGPCLSFWTGQIYL